MVQTSSVQAFRRSLDERFQQFRVDLDAVVHVFAVEAHGSNRMGAVKSLVEAARDLHDYLAEQDRPDWLTQVYRHGEAYLKHQNPKQAEDFLKALLKHHRSIRQMEFNDDAPAIDFDSLFIKYRDEGRLRELFDELMRIVNEIIASGEIDSITIVDTLNQILDLLKANRDGSYLAVKSTIKTTRFLKHLMDVALEEIPGIKQLREAWSRTIHEAEVEVANIESAIRDETLKSIDQRIRHLERLPNFAQEAVEFKAPLKLAGPADPTQSEITAFE